MTPKAALRERLMDLRRALPAAEYAARSLAAQHALLSLPELARARTVALYRPMGSEVDTRHLHEALGHLRRCYPALSPDGTTLRLLEASGGFTRSAQGFEVPEGAVEVPLAEVDVMVLPGVGFDATGTRLGRGAGHYDRLLALPHRALRVGLCFELQLLPEPLPRDPWDVPMHALCTEAGLRRALVPLAD